MATLSHTESRRLYSWWWDSHISPKNSKWLKENLTDMDVKIKSMIKLIEEDADSFRKRAEMYYRKRPELLKLVEEFYRAYRALAERYDHATGALHQAHQTMAKAFPDQVPFMLSDESPSGSSAIDPNESQEDDLDIPFDSINIKEKGLFSDGNGAIMSNEENVSKSETEIENLRDIVRNLEAEREQSQERVSSLEADISRVQGGFINLNEEMHVGITKLKSVEDQCRLLERENQSFQLELDAMKDKEKKQQEELDMKQEELEKLNSSLNDEHQRSMQAEMAHQSMALEVQELAEKLKHVEMSKISMEEEFQRKMVSLQYEISLLEESKRKLEDEMGVQVEEKKALQQEVSTVKEGKKDLEQRHHELNEQMRAANLNVKLLQELVMKHEDEKTQLLENLKSMENITERNVVLENSLSNANAELEELREKVKGLEESLGTLHEEVSMLLSEKTGLLMQVQAISQNMETVSKNNTLMENSLSDVKIELEDLRRMLNASEESCRSLNDQNSFIVAEKSVLVTKVESISNSLENLEGRHTELEDKYLNLEREKDCILDQVKELQNPVKLEKQEYETLVQSSRNQLAISKDQIGFLQEKDKLREELEVEHQKIIHAEMEVFILKSCLHDMKEQNMILLEKCGKYVEASRHKGEDIPEVKHVIEDLKTSISDDQDDILRLIIEKSVILTFFKQLVVEVAELKSQKSSLEQKSKKRSEDMELLQANQKFQAILDKNTELHGRIESLGVEKEELEENNLKLLEYHRYRDNEIAGLREANDTLNRLLDKLFEEVQELKNKEMQLTKEVKSSEVEIATLLKDIQVRTINSEVSEEKMKEKLDAADGENRGMKEELSAYLPLVLKLGDYVSSLEGHILSLAKHHPLSNQKQKSNPSSPHRKWSSERRNEDHCGTSGVGIFELQKLLAKASSLEKVAKDFQGHLYQDRFVPNTSLQADIRDNEGLKSNGTLDLKELPVGKNFTMNLETSMESSSVIKGISKDFIEGSEEMRKDIQLDHVSSPSQYNHCSSSHGPGTNGTDETIELDEMETPLLVTPKHGKELSIDKLNLTSTVTGSHQAWSASTSERLSLDFERLTLLQNSAKELRRNMEISELSKNPTSFQFKKVKAELKEAEGAISQLIDINSKLTKKTERHYSSSDSLISDHNDEIDNISERKISERAQRGSTKIGRLELEMQKLEYIWLKLKEENDYKKAIAAERRTRVLLRDYLYGRRESPRRRKVLCCAFMRPRTKDD